MLKVKVPKILVLFNFIVTRKYLVFSLLSIFCVISIFVSIIKKDFAWFSAYGGVATIFGILLTVSHSVPMSKEEINRFLDSLFPESRDGILSETESATNREARISKRISEANRILNSEAIGLIVTIIGTLIWAYGAFLNSFI